MSEGADPPVDYPALMRGTYVPADDEEGGGYRLHVRTAPEVMAIPDPPDSYRLLGPFVFRGYRTVVVGDTGHGKTTFSMQMLAAILTGGEMLGYTGAGVGPVMVVDLEQGIRSIKRGIRIAQLTEHEDALFISVPDGLALDQEQAHYQALDDVLYEHRPVAVLLDPYYKAHRAEDPNAERPIIDLMRTLDSLRVVHGFALILPAHPRKDVPGREGARRLTLHDIAGSGAAARGAELVLAVERLSHGYARLRYLKDRDGELEVNVAVPMLYDNEAGFHLDPRSTETDEGAEAAILGTEFGWATTNEWAKEVKVRHVRVKRLLEALTEQGKVAHMLGPPGRQSTARCYSTVPEHLAARQLAFSDEGAPVFPGVPDDPFAGLPGAREDPGTPGTPALPPGAGGVGLPGVPGGFLGTPGTGNTDTAPPAAPPAGGNTDDEGNPFIDAGA